jgi:hypothetical protein
VVLRKRHERWSMERRMDAGRDDKISRRRNTRCLAGNRCPATTTPRVITLPLDLNGTELCAIVAKLIVVATVRCTIMPRNYRQACLLLRVANAIRRVGSISASSRVLRIFRQDQSLGRHARGRRATHYLESLLTC